MDTFTEALFADRTSFLYVVKDASMNLTWSVVTRRSFLTLQCSCFGIATDPGIFVDVNLIIIMSRTCMTRDSAHACFACVTLTNSACSGVTMGWAGWRGPRVPSYATECVWATLRVKLNRRHGEGYDVQTEEHQTATPHSFHLELVFFDWCTSVIELTSFMMSRYQ